MQCSICEKAIYGHPVSSNKGPVVCGSCALVKTENSKTGKTVSQVRLSLIKTTVLQHDRKTLTMADLLVHSNYARNRTILLDGRFPLVFNTEGTARCPAELAEALGREMVAKPGRYWFVTSTVQVPVAAKVAPAVVAPVEEPAPAVVVAPVVVAPVVVAPVEVAPVVVDKQLELPFEAPPAEDIPAEKIEPSPVVVKGNKKHKK